MIAAPNITAATSRGWAEPLASHRPVMLAESLAGLAPRQGGLYIDATFGRGGHSEALLDAIGDAGRLHALDRDRQACQSAWSRLGKRQNFQIHHRNFAELAELGQELGVVGQVDGLLLDLGVSSPQLDEAERGFSFGKDGPLDMRMDADSGISAAEWLASADQSEIADVLWNYGQERASRRIAARIVAAREQAPIERTTQLADLILQTHRGPRQKIHPATRSFQAIRIHINGELDALRAALFAARDLLAEGGRLAVISFHSLEDRLVKRFLKEGRFESRAETPSADELLYGVHRPSSPFKSISREFASEAECRHNARARSAVLRVAEKRGDAVT